MKVGRSRAELVGYADTGLGAVLGHDFQPVFVEFTQELGDGILKFLCCEGVLLGADVALNQRGSVLQSLNESSVIHFRHFALLRWRMGCRAEYKKLPVEIARA